MGLDLQALGVIDMVRPDFHYGKSATRNAAPFSGIVFHHTSDKPAENLVRYGQSVDRQRGGAFGYHFYVAKDGRIIQGAPLDKRTNHIKPPGHGARHEGAPGDLSNANALGITLVGAEKGSTPQQRASAERLGRALMAEYGISGERVFGHGHLQRDRQHHEGVELVDLLRGVKVADAGGGFTREMIEAELRRRGALPEPKTNAGQFSREEIEAELRRRGALQESGGDITPEQRMQEKAAVESAVGQALGEGPGIRPADALALTPAGAAIGAVDRVLEQQRAASGETRPREGIEPTDLISVTPPGAALAAIKEYLPQNLQDALDQMIKGSSLNFSDELVGAASAVTGGDYEQARDAERARAKQFAAENPGTALASEIGGMLTLAPLTAANAVRGAGTAARVAVGAGEGAAVGAAAGAGAAEGDETLERATRGALGGAVAGGALTRAGISLERYMAGRALLKAARSDDEIKAAGAKLIQGAEKSGAVYRPDALVSLRDDLVRIMDDEAIRPGVDAAAYPAYRSVIASLNKAIDTGNPATLKGLAKEQAFAWRAWKKAQREGGDERLSAMLAGRIDDFMSDTGNMVVASSAAATRKEGAQLWRQHKKFREVQDIIEKATFQVASTGSGGNINNKLRQEFTKIVANKNWLKTFTPAEQDAIKAVAKQGFRGNALRLIGKLSPDGNGLMAGLQLYAAVSTGGMTAATIPLSMAAKKAADSGTSVRAQKVLATILSGGKPSPQQVNALNKGEISAISRALSAHYGETLGEPIEEGIKTLAGPEKTR